jgi:excisionase family DNA binding protein
VGARRGSTPGEFDKGDWSIPVRAVGWHTTARALGRTKAGLLENTTVWRIRSLSAFPRIVGINASVYCYSFHTTFGAAAMGVHTSYDRHVDECYLRLGETRAVAYSKTVMPGVKLDFDKEGRLLGVEVLAASRRLHRDVIESLEAPIDWMTLVEAGLYLHRSRSTLRVLLNAGKLKGRKKGRDWLVARRELDTYGDAVLWRLQRSIARDECAAVQRVRAQPRTR